MCVNLKFKWTLTVVQNGEITVFARVISAPAYFAHPNF